MALGTIQQFSWSWSFPTTNFQASTAKVAGYSIVTVDNTIYTYGGVAVDNNGYPNTNAVQNTLSFLDAGSFQVSTGSNGIGLTDHTTCYLKKLNSLITFGGSTTGSSTGVTDAVNIYNLSSKVWNVQGLSTLTAPAARRLHTANCLDDFMIVFGGGTSQPFDSDIWILNATSYPNMFWQRMSVANQTESPNPRMGHSSVLDSENNKLYIFGGWGVTGTNDSNMYVLDISHWSWTKVPTTGYAKNQVTTPSIPPLNTTATTATSENHQNKAGIIAGATVGGVVFLALLALALFFFKRRSRKEQEKDVTSSTHEDEQYVDKTSLPSDSYGRPPYRMSKAWSSTSFAKHSEIGDYSDRVVTGVLEAVTDAGTVAATHGSSRDSFRHSKTLLEIGPGQVPNEIISQKPNEFSVLIRPKHDLQVDHHRAALDDEDWTLPDSPLSPVQYIQTSSKPSIGTNSTWDTTEARRKVVTHHHPSSSIMTNTPVAQTVHIQDEEQSRPELYNRMSPLDLLASLGQHHHTESSGQSNSSGESFTILKSPSTSSSISDGLLTPIISLLPKRYQIDPTLPPIIGPSNSILFANDNITKMPVTIKLFGRREAWERECRALTKLKSPWVVELVEVLTLQKKENEEEVKYVAVMERLSETLNRKKNIMPQVVASHLLRALAYCHNYRIAFCDLKPSNVMHVDGTWKLIDFEASRTIEEECVGVMTPRYCAPEVAKATTYGLEGASGVVATASVDLWSLGCLIYVSFQ
ncbi:hypothetical protein RO3G_05567 [Rhizopus delemar RA 99-880]|uniref:Protein kinase domain-containing protein n=1 Tax=Rhizopus delemar (strain RA 99-880 / ATCC MYA-4621 / FGSC 9543 / NRRL 43880) TaxID=246409 RepID=I1BXD2_RHIO9|nr:hypothetical protein RO3G_05567 [Rhizopus delemar RA 99-880]|eukprot:EIE80862.1 hypothetical protein RO3G_05567 [Rhizopus delemar RA 99-880]